MCNFAKRAFPFQITHLGHPLFKTAIMLLTTKLIGESLPTVETRDSLCSSAKSEGRALATVVHHIVSEIEHNSHCAFTSR